MSTNITSEMARDVNVGVSGFHSILYTNQKKKVTPIIGYQNELGYQNAIKLRS